jgi:hypothetical protein
MFKANKTLSETFGKTFYPKADINKKVKLFFLLLHRAFWYTQIHKTNECTYLHL